MNDFLRKCSISKQLESAYALMLKTSLDRDCFSMNQFLTACSSRGFIDYAFQAFTQMENPNVFVYNALIRGLTHSSSSSSPVRALPIYIDMLRKGVSPSSYTFPSIIKACNLLSAKMFGESVHGQIWRIGFTSHLHVQTSLVDFYSNLCRIIDARKVFDQMPERDTFARSTMVSAYTRLGDMTSARNLFDEMPERDITSCNTMMDGYSRIGDVDSAASLFIEMPQKDLISWTTMINCYTQSHRYEKALSVFDEMKSNGINPDEVTIVTIISACAHLGALDFGKELYHYVMQIGFHLDVYIGSVLIDMFAKCGSLERSLVVFYKLQTKNLFCWNSIIEGLAMHGFAEQALKMFDKMIAANVEPNGVTFISVLSACTHAGLIEEGQRMFESMVKDFSLLPEIQHYGCMVHLLCKAGLLEDALRLIEQMKIEPNSVIWGALLGGCKLHKNVEIAEIAVERLAVMEPNNSGYRTLLVNIHAEANRWSEVSKIRLDMKERGVEKTCPGSSWIEIENEIHRFTASDKCHFAILDIYVMLNELNRHIKLVGYMNELELV
ncbi:pentatricopeptide repeat-containing protein At1g06143 [Impatiens glandulifera]|uniref:pentatricopeptide repeat-containing protein At1g06143 n=1 Tax=Impatiens glandulifera TaxID=253017 RepID=UPI001FB101B5|nr:pentatricopeptide repeat-containing protein At1g06143 [Impatiens glandulifera]